MAFTSIVDLAIAEMVIYLLLTPLSVYVLFKHKLVAALGWWYLNAFCIIRIVYDAIIIADRNKVEGVNVTSAVLNAVGLSPLLLASAGALHESTHYTLSPTSRSIRTLCLIVQVLVHIFAIGGIALGATAGVKLADPPTNGNNYDHDHHIQEAGACFVLLAFLLLVFYAVFLFAKLRRFNSPSTSASGRTGSRVVRDAKTLLYATMLALIFLGVRTAYALVYSFDHSSKVSPITAGFAVKFTLIFLVQLLAAVCLIGAGLVTRRIADEGREVGNRRAMEGGQQADYGMAMGGK